MLTEISLGLICFGLGIIVIIGIVAALTDPH